MVLEAIYYVASSLALITIATCQIKQAYFPIIYPADTQPGVELPDEVSVSEESPLYKMVEAAYQRKNMFVRPTEFVQRMIDDGDTGVEIITDKEEMEGR